MSLALATSVVAMAIPAHALAAPKTVALGSYAAGARLLVQADAPASVLGLDGDDSKAAQDLTVALRGAFKQRGLSGGEEISLLEMRMTMGCENLEPGCMAEGGAAIGVERLIYGTLMPQGPGNYQLELEILDVTSKVVEAQTSEKVTAEDLEPDRIDAKALAIVNGLLGSEEDDETVPGAVTTLPLEADPGESDPVVDDEPRESKYWFGRDKNGPTWKRAGLGVGIGLAVAGLGVGIGLGLQVKPAEDEVGKRVLETDSIAGTAIPPENRGSVDQICDKALSEPEPNKVFNKEVGEACLRGRGFNTGANVGWAVFGVGMATTIAFTVLLLVHKKQPGMETARRHQLRLGVAPTRGGMSFGSSFKF